ncbi:MAG TPA: hypothetical protein ENI60_09595 [Candidatus Fraserbacteria bacterium]|nr:hypothetical protein [Candidatus Fraserbacteria bacterium]
MVLKNYPWNPTAPKSSFDPWDHENMVLSPDGGVTPALRTEGSIKAMNAAYLSGQVFTGRISIPVLDIRPYLEAELNMHSTEQSFASRQRMIDAKGNADNQIIWEQDGDQNYGQIMLKATDTMDKWLAEARSHPGETVAESKPAAAVDSCFAADGTVIASGPGVWDGILNDKATGTCAKRFPIYSTSRIVAGGPIEGSVFKCQLKSVDQAIADEDYNGKIEVGSAAEARLKEIFPTGVCNYRKPDAGRPSGLWVVKP